MNVIKTTKHWLLKKSAEIHKFDKDWGCRLGALVAKMPIIGQKWLAKVIAYVAWHAIKKRGLVKKNITICLPALTTAQQEVLIKQHAQSIGDAFIGWVNAIYWTDNMIQQYTPHRIEGLEYLQQGNKGTLLLMKHSLHFLLDGRILGSLHSYGVVAKSHDRVNGIEGIYRSARLKAARLGSIEPHEVMKLMRWLKSGKTVLYAPDHDFGIENSEIIPFFGVPAATVRAPYKLQKATNCNVCLLNSYYDEAGVLVLSIRALDYLDKTNQNQFLLQMNQAITEDIARHPHEYSWRYKRFKSMGLYDK